MNARRTFYMKTLGCKVNQCDSQEIRERFLKSGWTEVETPRRAEACFLNTCCVTAAAERKSRQAMRQIVREKPRRSRFIALGCAAILKPGDFRSDDLSFLEAGSAGESGFSQPPRFAGHTRAFLKIQNGCDQRCAYCIVPLVRGPSKSEPFEEILRRAEYWTAAGHKEIVLTGVNLGVFGRDKDDAGALIRLLKALETLKGLGRVRLSSIEARDVAGALLEHMASSRKFCRHLHIPFQSGDDGVLSRMGRSGRVKDYLSMISQARRRVPGISFTCDMIVGFPAETEAAFERSLDFLKRLQPLRVHVFPYSPRPGTPAAEREKPLVPKVVQERARKMRALAERVSADVRRSYLGSLQDVLIEHVSKGFVWGYAGNYIKTYAKQDGYGPGVMIRVRMDAVVEDGVLGGVLS